ncbi:MAG TPA: hypothetical protein P5081_23775 [Phycisphaerae bacterium]|nr:hypothetical protein [Phycisphaerae bacterium]HRW55904.1 hypothetical protein [Phycisphaerae bacterium]
MGSAFPLCDCDSGEALPIEKSNSTKIVIASACLVAALGIWYWTGGEARRAEAERIESARGMAYRVECISCGYTGEIDGVDWARGQDSAGMSTCPKCGKQALRQLGPAGSDPAQFQAEVDAMTSVSEVEEAFYSSQEALDKLVAEMDTEPQDPERLKTLRRDRARLEAKIQALSFRWSMLLDPSKMPDQ